MAREHERGEWWIDENGQNLYADGDIGDINHEGHVIQTVLHRLADTLGIHDIDEPDWDTLCEKFFKKYLKEHEELEGQEIDTDLLLQAILELEEIDEETITVARGGGNARQYAAEKWGWKHVNDDDINTHTFTAADADTILDGLYDIHGELDNDDEFVIHVYTTGESHEVTVADLKYIAAGYGHIPRARQIAFELADRAALNYGDNQDKARMHPCYKGRIGD